MTSYEEKFLKSQWLQEAYNSGWGVNGTMDAIEKAAEFVIRYSEVSTVDFMKANNAPDWILVKGLRAVITTYAGILDTIYACVIEWKPEKHENFRDFFTEQVAEVALANFEGCARGFGTVLKKYHRGELTG